MYRNNRYKPKCTCVCMQMYEQIFCMLCIIHCMKVIAYQNTDLDLCGCPSKCTFDDTCYIVIPLPSVSVVPMYYTCVL